MYLYARGKLKGAMRDTDYGLVYESRINDNNNNDADDDDNFGTKTWHLVISNL